MSGPRREHLCRIAFRIGIAGLVVVLRLRTRRKWLRLVPRNGNSDLPAQLLLREFDQAWEHYRQNETLRTQYVGFLIAVVIGSAAYAASPAAQGQATSAPGLLVLAWLLLVVSLVAVLIHFAIRQTGVALHHYSAVWKQIRSNVYPADGGRLDRLADDIDIFKRPDVVRRRLSLQSSAEWISASAACVAVGGEVILLWRLLSFSPHLWQLVMMASVTAVAAVCAALTLIGRGLWSRTHGSDTGRAHTPK